MTKTIPQLTAASASALTDLIEVSQSSASRKETLQQVLTLYQQQGGFQLASYNFYDFSSGNVTLTNPAPPSMTLINAPSGRTLTMPAMNATNSWKVGQIIVIGNFSNFAITIKDNSGTNISTVNAITTHPGFTILYVADNSTAAGQLISIPFGTSAFLNASGAFGTAAFKNTSNTSYAIVAAVNGAVSGGNIAEFSNDEDGTIEDSGISSAQLLTSGGNLANVNDPYIACTNIKAMANNGASAPNLTGADVVLSNPAATYYNISNNNGTTGIQLPPPVSIDFGQAWQPGQIIRFNNSGGSNAVPVTDYLGNPIVTMLASSVYDIAIIDTDGTVDVMKLV